MSHFEYVESRTPVELITELEDMGVDAYITGAIKSTGLPILAKGLYLYVMLEVEAAVGNA